MKLGSPALVGGLSFAFDAQLFAQEKNRPIPKTISEDAIYYLNQQNFAPLVGADFEIADEQNSEKVSLRLIEVVNHKRDKNLQRGIVGENFSLIFEAANKEFLRDQFYQFSHSAIGEFSLFISTVGRSGARYQAVINRANRLK